MSDKISHKAMGLPGGVITAPDGPFTLQSWGERWQPTPYLRVHNSAKGGLLRQWWTCSNGACEWRSIEQISEGMPGWDAPPGQMPVVEGMSFAAKAVGK